MTTNIDANRTFQSMAIVYGFFFIFLSAVATMTSDVVNLYESEVFDLFYRNLGLYSYYALVIILALAMVFLGGGLMQSIIVMSLGDDYTVGFLILITALPFVYSFVIGFLLHLDLLLIIFESIVVLSVIGYILWKLRKDLG